MSIPVVIIIVIFMKGEFSSNAVTAHNVGHATGGFPLICRCLTALSYSAPVSRHCQQAPAPPNRHRVRVSGIAHIPELPYSSGHFFSYLHAGLINDKVRQ